MPTRERAFPTPAELDSLPPSVRATLRAARRAVRETAPRAAEVAYRSAPPASRSSLWKLARYRLGEGDVAGIGAFATHVCLYFHRGRELDDGSGLLEGGGKVMRFVRLASPADASSAPVRRLLRRAFRLGAAGARTAAQARPRSPKAPEAARTPRKVQGRPDSAARTQRR